jgi:hypothetical protein
LLLNRPCTTNNSSAIFASQVSPVTLSKVAMVAPCTAPTATLAIMTLGVDRQYKRDIPWLAKIALECGQIRFAETVARLQSGSTREGYGEGDERKTFVCHSFVTDGRIQYLGDCTHAMAGQTVDLPDIPSAHPDGGDQS